jgi:MFS family permease
MKVFLIIWLGQLVSLFGSNLTSFALGVWVYQNTASVTQYSLSTLAITLPWFIVSPVAGTLVDRWDRRWTMILSDSGSGLATLMIMLSAMTGHLAVWQVYLANGFSSICNTFQVPAYTAATTSFVSKEELSRVSGLRQLSFAVANLFAPMLAGSLLGLIHLQGITLIDFLTFCIALITLLLVRFPRNQFTNPQTECLSSDSSSLMKDTKAGFTYLIQRPGLLGLFLFTMGSNFLMSTVTILFTPLVLSFTSPVILGFLLTCGGVGMLFAGLLVSLWGGPTRQMNMIFGFTGLSGFCLITVGLPPFIPLYALAVFLFFLSITLVEIAEEVILQKKVDLSVQGRIFALKQTAFTGASTVAYVSAGILADQVFEPLMKPQGILANSLGLIIGVGTGRGIGLMFILMGFLTVLVTLIAYRYPKLRQIEDELPDS